MKRSSALLGNHNRSWIWGRHAVLEALRAGRWLPLQVLISDQLADAETAEFLRLTSRSQIELQFVPQGDLTKTCRAEDHQGIAARMPAFPYADWHEFLQRDPSRDALLLLDGVQDSFNLGAIIRGAEVLGISGVILGSQGQTGVNSQVVRSSAGAVHHVPITRVDDLLVAADQLHERGFQLVAASEKATVACMECDLTRPTVLVIGNEGTGTRAELLQRCQLRIRIPQFGRIGSLNAAVSAGILCYELQRQRTASQPVPPPPINE